MSHALAQKLATKIASLQPERDLGEVANLARQMAERRIGALNATGELFFPEESAVAANGLVPGIVSHEDIKGDSRSAKVARAQLRAQAYEANRAMQHQPTTGERLRDERISAYESRLQNEHARMQRIQARYATELVNYGSADFRRTRNAQIKARIIDEERARDGL